MSDNFLGPKPVRSVAAFLWMPQFGRSFRHFSHLVPVFVQVLSSVFISAGLLPKNHPSQFYGEEGVPKYGVGAIIGEAWYNMRRNRAGFSQWGVFAGVMLMMAMIIGSMVTFMMTVAFGVGTTAQAQLFSHPKGDSSFGSSDHGYNTDPTRDPFDRLIPPADTIAGDYGIMMLDKALRAGAHGQGGALQRGLQDLMLIYNSGILVIASVIIMWMIISIVVDTAKTGQVGGGRHNMVWTPIRIVFALALMVPLGSTGFSSGQFMVMKIAEWGSNFGTRAWSAYVKGVGDNVTFIAGSGGVDYAGEAVVSFTKMWLCRISANANLSISSHSDDDYVIEKTELYAPTYYAKGEPVKGAPTDKRVYFERAKSRGVCGSINIPLIDPADQYLGIDGRPMTTLNEAIKKLSYDMSLTFYKHLKTVEPRIIEFASNFAAGQEEMQGHALVDVSALGGSADKVFGTSGGETLGKWKQYALLQGTADSRPKDNTKEPLQSIVNDYQKLVRDDYNRALDRFQRSQGALIKEMSERGWAGMGVFYQRIADLNAAVFKAKSPTSVIDVGVIEDMEVDEDSFANRWGITENKTEWVKGTQKTLRDFQQWWTAVEDGAVLTASTRGVDSKSGSSAGVKRDPIGAALGQLGFDDNMVIIRVLSDDGEENLNKSPMAIVSSIGDYLFWIPIFCYTALTAFNVWFAISTGFVTGGAAPDVVADIIDFIMSLMFPMMVAGLMLKFYLPLIPFIRVVMSVLTWIISVFEAVVMVPIAALAHLTSQGEGLASGQAEAAWKMWLNMLLRPILTVIGFVGAMLVFNAFASYVNGAFAEMYEAKWKEMYMINMDWLVDMLVFAVLYTFIMYTVANTVFKMLDLIPDALGKWYGVPKDQSFDSINEAAIIGGQMLSRVGSAKMGRRRPPEKGKSEDENEDTGAKPVK